MKNISLVPYIAGDISQNWILSWDDKDDDINVEDCCSQSNDVVQLRAGQSN